jgi:hypothetical protein
MNSQFEAERKKMTSWAFWVTVLYAAFLVFLAVTLAAAGRAAEIGNMKPNEVGDLLAGVGGPFALIWLVYGYFLQGLAIRQQAEELSQNTHALHLQEEALRAQVHEMRESLRPMFVLRPMAWNGTRLDIDVRCTNAAATNIRVSVVSGVDPAITVDIQFLPKDGSEMHIFDPVIRPAMNAALGRNGGFSASVAFEYGSGLTDIEHFNYVEENPASLGRFINRKIIQ